MVLGQWLRLALILALLWAPTVVGCSSDGGLPTPPATAPALARADALVVDVVIPKASGPGLLLAADDLVQALAARSGAPARTVVKGAVPVRDGAIAVVVEISGKAEDPGYEGYRIERAGWAGGTVGLRVQAATELGASHGLRWLCEQLGVRWIHPEQTVIPAPDPKATLPWPATALTSAPRFGFRGLHEHTQHPIPASDFVLRPDAPGHAEMFRNWIRYIARNRNNVASFHMLKTVPLATFLPQLQAMVAQAAEHGVMLGMVTSFADQQQHNYKHIDESKLGSDGKALADDVQIRASLNALLGTGMRWIAVQLGTSEFTKPQDARVLGWLQTALDVAAQDHPGVQLFAWIHTTCSLKDEAGGYFYHLPLQSPAALGAWVHTTMFYDLEHPAPVYDCESFAQQQSFIDASKAKRPLVYFPETAWWLGFDNNVPLALPITGWARHRDAAGLDASVTGHVTFTTGREWGYWLYDHHVLRLGWDANVTWQAYLQELAPVFGPAGAKVASVLDRWADRQVQDHFEHNPMLTFYLAGELPQDEIGEVAGILARRPKPAFSKVLGYDDAAFAAWQQGDLADLAAMLPVYQALLDELPASSGADTTTAAGKQQDALYAEIRAVLWLHVQRIAHTLRLYEAVVALRPWQVELSKAGPTGDPDVVIRDAARAAAQAKLADAVTIGDAVAKALVDGEARYRSPLAMLARAKPETLTSYPFGYLEQTGTALFWRRREQQLQGLIDKVGGGGKQVWAGTSELVAYSGKDETKLLAPAHPVAQGALPGFVPRLLWALDAGAIAGDGNVALAIATDFDANNAPDTASEQDVALAAVAGKPGSYSGALSPFSLTVQDSAGNELGTLHLLDAKFGVELTLTGGKVTAVGAISVSGDTPTSGFLAMMKAVGGIDEAGATTLLKTVFGLKSSDPTPLSFPVSFGFAPKAVP